jgi:hypothetical protein
MDPVSDTFIDAVSASCQTAVIKASVLLGDDILGDLLVTGGSVMMDGTSDGVLRSLSLTCAPDPDVWEWITAAGAEIQVWRGLTLPGGDVLASLGVFVIDADPEEGMDGSVTISAADRSKRITRAGWTDPYAVPAGIDVGDAITGILRTCWPACPIGFGQTGKMLGSLALFQDGADSDPWKDARALAATAGLDLYFDAGGVAKLRPVPDPATADPCMTYRDGEAGVIVTSKRVALLSQLYNGVIARAEGSGVAVPVRGECWDEDPTSPTYRYGPLGQIPYNYSSPLLVTQDEVDSAAQTTYGRIKGRTEQRMWEMVPNPALEAFDVVDLVAIDGTRTRYMLDQLTIPLDSANMSVTARKTAVA